jgi:hypothetical protein
MNQNYIIINGELYHHGIKGMKWGVRRYQNKDGSLTALGKRRAKPDGTFKTDREMREEIKNERFKLREEYRTQYGVKKAYEDADAYYYKNDMDSKTEALYEKADILSSKADKAVDKMLKTKYGSDYDKFVSRETTQNGMILAGTLIGSIGVTAGVIGGGQALLKVGAKGAAKLGTKIVDALIKSASK